ncbi:hypothetical protein [Aeoliella sp.]|uniref:hypothetical protein n=1 Tax=Aeoliella sp. TaxID=2795800 RepID=UPI003CCC0EC8
MTKTDFNVEEIDMPRFQFSLRRLLASMLLAILSIQCWWGWGWAMDHHWPMLVFTCYLGGFACAGASFGTLLGDAVAGLHFGLIMAVVIPMVFIY